MSKQADRKAMGERIRDARTYAELSQDEVAQALSIPRSAVSEIENGTRGLDTLEAKMLAKVLNCSILQLTGDDAEVTAEQPLGVLARAAKGLSEADLGELQRFASYLRSRAE